MITEAIFSTITKAVFSEILEYTRLDDRLRRWLGKDPAHLAFQKALARAFTAFARQYPELVAGLFDLSFLQKEAASELARLLTVKRRRLCGLAKTGKYLTSTQASVRDVTPPQETPLFKKAPLPVSPGGTPFS